VEQVEVPLLLASYHMVFFHQGYEAGLNRLAGDLGLSVAPAEPAPAPRQEPQPVPVPEVVSPPVVEPSQPFEPELIHVPAGEFLMGSDPKKDKGAYDDEQPQHSLHLPDYYIAKTPVTNGQYLASVEATGQKPPEHWKKRKPPKGKKDHPVVEVSWHDAVAYCQWLAEATGRAYRLPSEAEWEKAARGGLRMGREDNPYPGRIYPWGNEWEKKRCNSEEGGPGDTTPVGQYSPGGDSPYGCVDMAGNVVEWTLSLWGKEWEAPDFRYPYDPEDGRENLDAGDDIRRALRGGSWNDNHWGARVSARINLGPGYFSYSVGFRVVVPPVSSS
jgi:formylglycine-generating enzyme required for sulfatase activity